MGSFFYALTVSRDHFCTDLSGHANCVSGLAPNGRQPFSAPAERGTRTAAGVFALSGRGVFRCTSAGDSPSADGGNVPRPAAGAKRKDNLRFSFLFELLPFPYLLAWRRPETGDRFETGERQSGDRCVSFVKCSQFTDSVLLHRWFYQRRRDTR